MVRAANYVPMGSLYRDRRAKEHWESHISTAKFVYMYLCSNNVAIKRSAELNIVELKMLLVKMEVTLNND